MKLKVLIAAFLAILPASVPFVPGCAAQDSTAAVSEGPACVHPELGKSFSAGGIKITLSTRKQNYNWRETATRDKDIHSPKSVNFHPSGEKYYVNSLEGGTTVVFDYATGEKTAVIRHTFGAGSDSLWARPSGYFNFSYKYADSLSFTGRPVESTFTHGGRYLWVPYYRRSFDLNAQEPSAVSVIDTQKDTIIRLFETGPLPKMIAVSPNDSLLAITHWGDNTVGLMDVSSDEPSDWHYVGCYTVGRRLKLNFPRDTKVDRDVNSGYCLRGTVFTPDNRYLLVGCMGGGGIAVIDLQNGKYLGRMLGAMANLRHLVIDRGWLYASINKYGYVQRIRLDDFLAALETIDKEKATVTGWENCKVPAGARTIVISPDGKYVFAACNYSSCISIVSTDPMKLIGQIQADSFPVGLDISQDGTKLISTSQARGAGGNCVDIFTIEYK